MLELTRAYHFSAAHRLENPRLAPADNERLYGACFRPHGHNYYLEVTVRGAPDRETGMCVDLDTLDGVVQREVLAHVDHRALETAPVLAGVITTGEGLARAFWGRLRAALGDRLARVTVIETAKNRFEYRGEPEEAER
jgi:6-pyruvoyltetrahydropterin/6-carboxytetrahydropterin synthase